MNIVLIEPFFTGSHKQWALGYKYHSKHNIDIISREGKASTSLLQRKLQIGYNRAARIMDQLEEQGYISSANHVGKREINYDKFTT